MAPFFSSEKLTELDEQREKLIHQYLDLVLRFQARSYRSERGKEYATHGFGRRLEILRTAIDQVFLALPPDLEEIPDQPEILTATIAIQAFVLNVVGCLDNLAWVWVFEKAVTATNGAELDPKMVGLWKRGVQDSMSVELALCHEVIDLVRREAGPTLRLAIRSPASPAAALACRAAIGQPRRP
jgi:hypothetical protein